MYSAAREKCNAGIIRSSNGDYNDRLESSSTLLLRYIHLVLPNNAAESNGFCATFGPDCSESPPDAPLLLSISADQ